MTTWTKVNRRTNFKGRDPRKTFGVSNMNGNLRFLVPEGQTHANAANIFTDGNGRIAYQFSDDGTYKAYKAKNGQRQKTFTIPSEYADRIPAGTRDAKVERDGEMFVLDLSQFSQAGAG